MDKGYFIFAQGKDYIRQAYALALSIKNTQTINSVCVAVGKNDVVPNAYKEVFDHIVICRLIEFHVDGAIVVGCIAAV